MIYISGAKTNPFERFIRLGVIRNTFDIDISFNYIRYTKEQNPLR